MYMRHAVRLYLHQNACNFSSFSSHVMLLVSFAPGMAGQAHHCHETHLGGRIHSSRQPCVLQAEYVHVARRCQEDM